MGVGAPNIIFLHLTVVPLLLHQQVRDALANIYFEVYMRNGVLFNPREKTALSIAAL